MGCTDGGFDMNPYMAAVEADEPNIVVEELM